MAKGTNQYLRDDVLYFKVVNGVITELSIRGDKLVLYTESNEIFQKLKQWEQLLYQVPYFQDRRQIAADLYFPKETKKDLLRVFSRLTQAAPKVQFHR